MMKSLVMTALALVLAAQAAPALAQDRGGDRGERSEMRGRPQGDGRGVRAQREWDESRGSRGDAPRAAEAPQAPQAPQAATPRRRDGDRTFQDRGQRGDGVRGDVRRGDGQRGDDRRDDDGRRDWNGRGDNDRRDWDGRRDHDRRDWDHRGDGRRDWDRRDHDHDHDRWDGRRGDHRRWERGRYPSVYFSSHRYRYAWRPPSGFYLHSWSYGDFYPRAWYGAGYWIIDPWQYDLPLPPPGFDWVRSGPDALLIDRYTGRIVQVVRNIFWY